MNNYLNKIYKFMYDRYGIDELYKFSFVIYLLLLIINIFLQSKVVSILELLIIISMIYRSFSKDIKKRKDENKFYLKIKRRVLIYPHLWQKSFQDRDHVYRRCHHCKATLKLPLPKKVGIKHTDCPICKKENTYLILRREKIEVIRGDKN